MKKARLTWTIKKMADMCKNGNITFDNAVQRSLIWDTDRKSLLIHSAICDYLVPALCTRKTNKKYDMLDGKQRCNAFISFMNDEFALSNIPEVTLDDEDGGTIFDLNGKIYSELDESIQNLIKDFVLDVYYFDDITDDQVADIFFRINNGKPLSAIELTRCKAKSMKEIIRIGSHELFTNSLTSKALEKYTNEDLVIKTYIMLHESEPCLDTKVVRPIMENAIITEQDESQINEVYNRILNVYNLIEDKKIAKRMLSRTHMVSIVPFVWRSICDGMSDQQFAEWFQSFFDGKKSATNNEVYNENARRSTGRKDTIRKRIAELENSWNKFFADFYAYYGNRKKELNKTPDNVKNDTTSDNDVTEPLEAIIDHENIEPINNHDALENSNTELIERSVSECDDYEGNEISDSKENEEDNDISNNGYNIDKTSDLNDNDDSNNDDYDPEIESFIDEMVNQKNEVSSNYTESELENESSISLIVDEIMDSAMSSESNE